MNSNDWQKDVYGRYDNIRENISGLKPWNRRLLFLLPPLLIFSWVIFLFNPLNAEAGSLEPQIIDSPIDASKSFTSLTFEDTLQPLSSTPTMAEPTPQPELEEILPTLSPVVQQKSEILTFNETKIALLIEDRPLGQLAPLMLHMIQVIPSDWVFRFYGSKESINHLNHSLPIQMWERLGKLTMLPVPSNLTLHGQQELSKTFTDVWFYETMLAPAEYLLVFQTDSIMCANSGMNLNDWLHYDWVGAPWVKNAAYGGNGGLSLRRVRPIIDLLKKESRPDGHPELEDLWLCNRLAKMPGINMANGSMEAQFSVEAVWQERPMGYHTGWSGARLPGDVWGTAEKRKHIYDYCPEMKMTVAMKLEREGCDDKRKRDEESVWSEIAAF